MNSTFFRDLSLCGVAIFTASCQSTPPANNGMLSPKPQKTSAQNSEKMLAFDFNTIDSLFQKKKCLEVTEQSQKTDRTARAGTPLLTLLFVDYCESAIEPKNTEKLKQVIATIEKVEEHYSQSEIISIGKTSELKAVRYLEAEDTENAYKWFQESHKAYLEKSQQAKKLEPQILDLALTQNNISAAERIQFRELSQLSGNDEKLFDALKLANDLLAQSTAKDLRNIIFEQRSRVIARIELLFALDMSQLESFKSRGQDTEANKLANEMKSKFPQRNYEVRIDMVANTAGAQGGSVSPSSATAQGTNSLSNSILDANLTEAQKSERALVEARALLDAGQPAKTVEMIDSLPETLQTDKIRRLRQEAADVHVRELRSFSNALYRRAQVQKNSSDKIETLNKAQQALETILSKYPKSNVKNAVERSIKSIRAEISELGKSK